MMYLSNILFFSSRYTSFNNYLSGRPSDANSLTPVRSPTNLDNVKMEPRDPLNQHQQQLQQQQQLQSEDEGNDSVF